MPEGNPYAIEILDLTLDVLECLQDHAGEPLRASVIARKLGVNRGRIFRILKTLESRGYIDLDAKSLGYQLGLKFLSLAEVIRERLDLRREAAPILMELARATGDTAHLLVRYSDSAVCIDRYQGEHMLQVAVPIGLPMPLHIGASPKILLAYLPDEERERLIDSLELTPFTPNTITDPFTLRSCLAQIRSQEYVVDEQDFEKGVYAIGAPVFDHLGSVIAGITVTVPESRYNPQRRAQVIHQVVEAANQLSVKLGRRVCSAEKVNG